MVDYPRKPRRLHREKPECAWGDCLRRRRSKATNRTVRYVSQMEADSYYRVLRLCPRRTRLAGLSMTRLISRLTPPGGPV